MSAGVVPFCIEATTHTIYILLARRAAHMYHRPGKGVWSDLGGSAMREDGDDSARTAAREFMEESLGTVHLFEHLDVAPADYCDVMWQELRENKYSLRVTQILRSPMDEQLSRRVFYVKKVPFDAELTQAFFDARSQLLRLPEHPDPAQLPAFFVNHPAIRTGSVASAFLEKDRVKWFSLDHVLRALKKPCSKLFVRPSFRPALAVIAAKLSEI